jgi:hypothetical protein
MILKIDKIELNVTQIVHKDTQKRLNRIISEAKLIGFKITQSDSINRKLKEQYINLTFTNRATEEVECIFTFIKKPITNTLVGLKINFGDGCIETKLFDKNFLEPISKLKELISSTRIIPKSQRII